MFENMYRWFGYDGRFLKIFDSFTSYDEDGNVVELLSASFAGPLITVFAISVVVAFVFYIWPIDHPRFKAWWAWLIMLGCNLIIDFLLVLGISRARVSYIDDLPIDNNEEAWARVLNVTEDSLPESVGSNLADSLSVGEYLDFAFINVLWALLFFVLASSVLMWLSNNCRLSPFKK